MFIALQHADGRAEMNPLTWGKALRLARLGGWGPAVDAGDSGEVWEALYLPRLPRCVSQDESSALVDALERSLNRVPKQMTRVGEIPIIDSLLAFQKVLVATSDLDFFSGSEGRRQIFLLVDFAKSGAFTVTFETQRERTAQYQYRATAINTHAFRYEDRFHLVNPEGYWEIRAQEWHFVLQLAKLGGWEPAGTVCDRLNGWSGSYVHRERALVREGDARALGDAIEKMLPDIPDEDVARFEGPKMELADGRVVAMADMSMSAIEYLSGVEYKQWLVQIVAFFRSGPFRIE